MSGGQPEEVQQKKVLLAGGQSHTAAYHLLVKAANLGGTKNHNTVHGWTVPAFGQQHAVAQDGISAVFKIPEYIGPVCAVAVHLRSRHTHLVQQVAEGLGNMDQGQENHGFAVGIVFHHLRYNVSSFVDGRHSAS